MKTCFALLAILALVQVSACTSPAMQSAHDRAEPVSQRWSGDYPVSELGRLPAGQQATGIGFFSTPAEFEAAWSAFKPGEAVPAVDFDGNIVVFVRNLIFYNRTNIVKTDLKDGVLKVLAMETMSANPITDKVVMAMALVPRQGIQFIQAGAERLPIDGR